MLDATVDLDFVNGAYNGTSLATNFVAVANLTGGYVQNLDGTLTLKAANTARIGVGKGLLIEESRTNVMQRSQELDFWSVQNVTPTTDAGAAPDGTTTADRLASNGGQYPEFYKAAGSAGSLSLTQLTYSVYVKPETGRYFLLNANGNSNSNISVVFDLNGAGSVTNTQAGSVTSTLTDYGIEALANNWYRVWMVGTIAAGGSVFMTLGVTGVATGHSFNSYGECNPVPAAGLTYLLWGAQMEVGRRPTSYIPTTTASVTRAADVVTLINSIPAAVNGAAGTVIVETAPPIWTPFDAVYPGLFGSSAGALYSEGNAQIANNNFNGLGGGDIIRRTALSSIFSTSVMRSGLAWTAAGGRSATANGESIGSATDSAASFYNQSGHPGTPGGLGGTLPLYLGSVTGTSQWINGYIRRFSCWNSRLSDVALQTLTQLGLGTVYLDPDYVGPTIALSNVNLTALQTAAATGNVRTNKHHLRGEYYYEFTVDVTGNMQVGLCNSNLPLTEYLGQTSAQSIGVDDVSGWLGAGGTITAPALINGHTYGVAVDISAGKAWCKDITAGGYWNADASANPVTGVNGATFFGTAIENLLEEDFSRYADATVMAGQVPLIGPAWGTNGASLPTTSGGLLTNTGSGYLYNILPNAPTTLTADVAWFAADAGTVTISFAGNDDPFTLYDLIHMIVRYNDFSVTTRLDEGAFVGVLSDNWPTPLVTDGRIYHIEMAVSGDTLIVTGPTGEVWTTTHASVSDGYGKVIYWQAGTSGRIAEVTATSAAMPTDLGAPFDPATDVNVTLSNANRSVEGFGAINKTARSLVTRSTGKAQVEFVINVHASPTADNLGIGFGSNASWGAVNIGDDAFSVAIYPRGATTGIWANSAYRVTSLNISGAAGTRIAMRVNFDATTVSFKDITNGGAWTTPFNYSAFVSGAPYSVGASPSVNADKVTAYTRLVDMVTPLDSGYETWGP